jgi:hypothetical protein
MIQTFTPVPQCSTALAVDPHVLKAALHAQVP